MNGIGSLAAYENFEQVGEGTYGYVFRATSKATRDTVALKKLIFHKEASGFPICAIREIKFLKSLQHQNIVRLIDIATSKGCEHLDASFKSGLSKGALQQQQHNIQLQNANEKGAAAKNQNDDTTAAAAKHPEQKQSQHHNRETSLTQLRRCGNLYLVFEYLEHDLGGLIDAKYKFSTMSMKCIMKQLFEVLDFLSERKILHRDIKSSNILISNYHHIKLADFGLARSTLSTDGEEGEIDLTNNVITMWYKPPELLLGTQRYSYAVDMWSMGCVMAELEIGRPLFPGKTEAEQLDMIFKVIGTPSEDSWQEITQLPYYQTMYKTATKYPKSSFRTSYAGKLSDATLDLLERILVCDPIRRTSAKIALSNKFFVSPPIPPANPATLEPLSLPLGASLHEYQTKQRRKQAEEDQKKAAKMNPFLAGPSVDSQDDFDAAPILVPPLIVTNRPSYGNPNSSVGYYPAMAHQAPIHSGNKRTFEQANHLGDFNSGVQQQGLPYRAPNGVAFRPPPPPMPTFHADGRPPRSHHSGYNAHMSSSDSSSSSGSVSRNASSGGGDYPQQYYPVSMPMQQGYQSHQRPPQPRAYHQHHQHYNHNYNYHPPAPLQSAPPRSGHNSGGNSSSSGSW